MDIRAPESKLRRLLPPAPARLLLLTDDPENEVASWAALGYDVRVGALYEPGQYIQFPSATRQEICAAQVGLADADLGSCEVALVLGLSPLVHPLAFFNAIAQWLVDGATVVLTGCSALIPSRPQHWLDYAMAIGGRCGFVEQPTSDSLGTEAEGRFVRVLCKTAPPRWQLRHVQPQDFEDVSTLFQEVFGHSLSRELWAWKYAQGRGNAVVATRNGEVVAHYAGMYRDILLNGTPAWAFQACDVMVHPKERGVMTKQGPFLLTAATVAEIYAPMGKGFGFPNARAMLVAEKMGLYTEVGYMVAVRWQPAPQQYRWRTRVRALAHHGTADQAKVQALWTAMARDLESSVVGYRDWGYLEQRYLSHPHNHYELILVSARLTGSPVGVLVLRRLEDSCELLDVIAPLANLPMLIDQARRLTGRWGLPSLYCWITKNQAHHFLRCGDGKEEALNIRIPASCWTKESRTDMFKDRWWLMSGDTDFR